MYGKLIGLRDFKSDALAEANNRSTYYELVRTQPKESQSVALALRSLVNSILCSDYLNCQAAGGNEGADGTETAKLEELITLADEHNVEAITTTIEIAIYRQMAIKAFNACKWKVAVLLLNKIVARVCTPADLNQKSVSTVLPSFSPCLGDALMMLSEAYAQLGQTQDAMKSARCAVDIVQSGIEREQSAASPPDGAAPPSSLEDSWDIGPGLQPPYSLVCCYFNLGNLLDKVGLLKFGVGWYKRALTVATINSLERSLITQLKEAHSMAESFLKLDSRSDVLVIESHHNQGENPAAPVSAPGPQTDQAEPESRRARSSSNSNSNSGKSRNRSGSANGNGSGDSRQVVVGGFASPHSRGPSLKETGKSKSALPRLARDDEVDIDDRIIPNPFRGSSSNVYMPGISAQSPGKQLQSPGNASSKAPRGKAPHLSVQASAGSMMPVSALTSFKGTPKKEDSMSLDGFENDEEGLGDDSMLFNDDVRVGNMPIPIPVPVLHEVVMAERELVRSSEEAGEAERKVYVSAGTKATSELQVVKKGKSGKDKNARPVSQDSARDSVASSGTGRSDDSTARRERKRKCKSSTEYRAAYKIMHYAATVINSVGRGYVTRKYLKAVKKHSTFMGKLRRERRAAVRIQAGVRSHLARRKVHSLLLLRSSLTALTLGNAMKSTLNANSDPTFSHNPHQEADGPFSPGRQSSVADMAVVKYDFVSTRSSSNLDSKRKTIHHPVITNGDMEAMIKYIQTERRGIAAKQAELVRLSDLEKKKLNTMLEELAKRADFLEKKAPSSLSKSPSRRGWCTPQGSPGSPKHCQSPNTEFKSKPRGKTDGDKKSKSVEVEPAAPPNAKYHKGQKVEAKYLGSVIKHHNVTWHGSRILHVHDRKHRAGEKFEFFYDVIFSNGEIELKVADEYIRLPLSCFSALQNAKSASAVTTKTADEKAVPGVVQPTPSRMVVARRNMQETAMHKFAMHAQFQSIGRKNKRQQERLACRNHNIAIFQKVYRGFIVRKYFYRYRKYVMKERLIFSVEAKSKGKKASEALILLSFVDFRAKYYHRMKRDAREEASPVKAGLTVAHNTMDEQLHAENKLLNSEIQEYYDMLIKCQCELQKMRNEIYVRSHSATEKISRLHNYIQETVSQQQEQHDVSRQRQGSPVFARLSKSPSALEVSTDDMDISRISADQRYSNSNLVDTSATEVDVDAPDDSINFLDMRVVHNIVQEFVQSTISAALTPKK